LERLDQLLEAAEFRAGLALGTGAALLAVLGGLAVASMRPPPAATSRAPGLAGVAFAAGAAVACARHSRLTGDVAPPAELFVAVALAGAVGALVGWARHPAVWAAAALPGAILAGEALIEVPGWVRIAVTCFVVAGSAFGADFDDRGARFGLGPPAFAITVAAVYSTVPDTEFARALLGAALPLALLGLPGIRLRMGVAGTFASVALLGWVLGQEGAARPGAVVGGLATLGLLVIEPLVRHARPSLVPAPAPPAGRTRSPAVPVLAGQAAIALAAARWAGFAHDALSAAVRLAVVVPAGALLALALPPLRRVESAARRRGRAPTQRSRRSGRDR
jgi:hypothetical protein